MSTYWKKQWENDVLLYIEQSVVRTHTPRVFSQQRDKNSDV